MLQHSQHGQHQPNYSLTIKQQAQDLFLGFLLALNIYIMIFESPDGGKTIYGRLPHSIQRQELNPLDQEQVEINNLWFAWRDILTASKTNPVLKEALDRAQIIYELSRHDKD